MSKLKRAQKYIGKKIKYLHNTPLIEDVVYISKEDSRHLVLYAPLGLCFKTAADEEQLAERKVSLENLKERFFKIDAGILISEYSTKEEWMGSTLNAINELQAQLEHSECASVFIRVNSRCRHEIVD